MKLRTRNHRAYLQHDKGAAADGKRLDGLMAAREI